MSELIPLLKEVGSPLAVPLVLAWIAIKAGKFLAPHVADLLGSQITLTRSLNEHLPEQTRLIRDQTQQLDEVHEKVVRNR